MAGGARRSRGVVHTQHPIRRVQVQVVLQVAVGDAVLGLLVDLLLRVVRAEVALAAVLGLPRAPRREVVAAVAGRAGAARAVQVQAADAGVGPRAGVQQRPAVLVAHDAAHRVEIGRAPLRVRLQVVHREPAAIGGLQRHLRAVALLAPGEGAREAVHHLHHLTRRRRVRVERHPRPLDRLRQEVVQRGEDVPTRRVVALRKLRGLVVMTARTVARRDHRRDLLPVMQIAVRLLERGLVALHAAHALLGVRAAIPVRDDPGVLLGVAVHALPRPGGDRDPGSPEPGLLRLARRLHPLNEDQGEQEEAAECGDDNAFGLEGHGWPLYVRSRFSRRRRCSVSPTSA